MYLYYSISTIRDLGAISGAQSNRSGHETVRRIIRSPLDNIGAKARHYLRKHRSDAFGSYSNIIDAYFKTNTGWKRTRSIISQQDRVQCSFLQDESSFCQDFHCLLPIQVRHDVKWRPSSYGERYCQPSRSSTAVAVEIGMECFVPKYVTSLLVRRAS